MKPKRYLLLDHASLDLYVGFRQEDEVRPEVVANMAIGDCRPIGSEAVGGIPRFELMRER